ncbi:MAG TPA: hypothetical protein VFC61_06820 [Blastocatellia bacterium]|nr:hypothetical protein [Blastocatellia bacterium]
MVTRGTTATVIGLALLTLIGFMIVSQLLGARGPEQPAVGSAQSRPTPGNKPQGAISPLPPASKSAQDDRQMQTDLARAQGLIDQMMGAVAANDWVGAQALYAEFARKTEQLPAPQLHHPDISPVLQDFFAYQVVQLERSLAGQNGWQAAFALSQLGGIVGEQRVRIGARGLPPEVPRLRFLIREIELWGQAGDEKMLRVRAVALRDAWRDLQPVVTARKNGVEAAATFKALVARLSAAEQIQEVLALAPEFNRALDQMDALFHRTARAADPGGSAARPTEDDDDE